MPQYQAWVHSPPGARAAGAAATRQVLVQADSPSAVASVLGLPPTAVLSVQAVAATRARAASRIELRLFSQELALLLQSGIPLLESLQTLRERDGAGPADSALDRVIAALRQGQPLSAALQTAPQDFDGLFVAIVAASERSGLLARSLRDHAAYLNWASALHSRLVAAAIYPLLLLGAGTGVLLFLMLYVLPRFAGIFEGLGDAVPLGSRVLIGVGSWAAQHPLVTGSVLAALVALPLLAWRRPGLRAALVAWAWRWPALRARWRTVALARLYRCLAVLMQAGVPVPAALRLTGPALPAPLRPALDDAVLAVESGRRLSQALADAGLATPVALRMVRVGEGTGELPTMLERAASFHDEEIARLAEWVTRAVNPVLMLVMGVLIGGVVVLMYLPIFTLMEQLP
jgi:general secretion pathway protein F